MRHLLMYPNCSKGGVTSVLLGRARENPEDSYDIIFWADRGGRSAFQDVPNIRIRVIPENRVVKTVAWAAKTFDYDSITVLSSPKIANALTGEHNLEINYEFHSPHRGIIEYELRVLELENVRNIIAPSFYYASFIRKIVPEEHSSKVHGVRNLLDKRHFGKNRDLDLSETKLDSDGSKWNISPFEIPLIVIGRFEDSKGFHEALNLMSLIDDRYTVIFLTSLETNVALFTEFYLHAERKNLLDRIRIFRNLNGREVSSLMETVRANGGFLLSVAQYESFGYAVGEAIASRLPVLTYDLAVWKEFNEGYVKSFRQNDIASIANFLQKYIGEEY